MHVASDVEDLAIGFTSSETKQRDFASDQSKARRCAIDNEDVQGPTRAKNRRAEFQSAVESNSEMGVLGVSPNSYKTHQPSMATSLASVLGAALGGGGTWRRILGLAKGGQRARVLR